MSRQERARVVLTTMLASEASAGEAVQRATQGTGATKMEATRALYSLLDENKGMIFDPAPPKTVLEYLGQPYSLWFWGVAVVLAAAFASIYVLPQTPPFVYVRYVFGAIVVLYLSGYTLIEALYPKKDDLDSLERLALSIGLSLALVPLVGLVLNYTPWGIRLDPIIISLSTLDVALAVAGAYRKESYLRLAAAASR